MGRNARLLARVGCLIVFLITSRIVGASVTRVTLNGLDLRIDEQTGSLVYLSYPATGVILQASPESAGLLDVAYPIESFAPLRLATQFSKARIAKGPNRLTITWDQLGPSRSNFKLPGGKVSAQVTIRAADDLRSVILNCRIENRSDAPIPQILFPDLRGLRPFDGKEKMLLRLGNTSVYPFMKLQSGLDSPWWYYERGWKQYPEGWTFLRWLDYGSLRGGLSLFHKKWNTPDKPLLRSFRGEADPMSLRLMWEHPRSLPPGQEWDSGEFWLTPHPGGWAKGIEVYRNYLKQAVPPRALPKRIREGLGYQGVWMIEDGESDPGRAFFRFRDIPRVARDAREHGIDELMIWYWCTYCTMPIPTRKELGGREEFIGAVAQARNMGVNITPLLNVRTVPRNHKERYGPGVETNWTFHSELIPTFAPTFALHRWQSGYEPDVLNAQWQKDVLAALGEWIDAASHPFHLISSGRLRNWCP